MLRKDPARAEADDAVARELWTTEIRLAVVEAFKSIDMINTELRMLAQAPPPSLRSGEGESDARQRGRERSDYSERLDPPLSQLAPNSGPLLDRQGRPQRLFTIVDKRTQLQQGVFRPDHNLPTMSIDEYLDEERRRGGIIEGGGEASGRRPQVDEDDMDKADEETIKAREWDEFKEANPRGSGNTLNQG
jgi:immunoglobulin-binding protein 1